MTVKQSDVPKIAGKHWMKQPCVAIWNDKVQTAGVPESNQTYQSEYSKISSSLCVYVWRGVSSFICRYVDISLSLECLPSSKCKHSSALRFHIAGQQQSEKLSVHIQGVCFSLVKHSPSVSQHCLTTLKQLALVLYCRMQRTEGVTNRETGMTVFLAAGETVSQGLTVRCIHWDIITFHTVPPTGHCYKVFHGLLLNLHRTKHEICVHCKSQVHIG